MKPLSAAAATRIKRRRALLENLIVQMKNAFDVPIALVKQALTGPEFACYRAQLPPSAKAGLTANTYQSLKLYGAKLRKADRLFAWAERVAPSGSIGLKRWRLNTPRRQADAAYEHAYEYLEELVTMGVGFSTFLDRPVHFKEGEWPDSNPDCAPRLVGSRSQYALKGIDEVKADAIALKLVTLENSLRQIDEPEWALGTGNFFQGTDGNIYDGFPASDFDTYRPPSLENSFAEQDHNTVKPLRQHPAGANWSTK